MFYPQPEPFGSNADDARPFGHAFRLSVMRYESVSRGILGLLYRGSPPHISGFVVLATIYAIYAMLGSWSFTDVGEKGEEIILPCRVHFNPPSPIEVEMRVSGIAASRPHGDPGPVLHSCTRPYPPLTVSGNRGYPASARAIVSATLHRESERLYVERLSADLTGACWHT